MLGRFVAVLAVFSMLAVGPVLAANGKAQDTAKRAGQGNRIGLEEARQIALKSYPGTVLETEKDDDLYEIKIRTDAGETIKVKIDPVDGSLVSFKKKTRAKVTQ